MMPKNFGVLSRLRACVDSDVALVGRAEAFLTLPIHLGYRSVPQEQIFYLQQPVEGTLTIVQDFFPLWLLAKF